MYEAGATTVHLTRVKYSEFKAQNKNYYNHTFKPEGFILTQLKEMANEFSADQIAGKTWSGCVNQNIKIKWPIFGQLGGY